MKTIAVITLAIFLTGCDNISNQQRLQNKIDNAPIVTRNNCEYLMFYNAYGDIGMHKGDCNNPIHIYKKLPQTGK